MNFQDDLNKLAKDSNPIAELLAKKIKNINDSFEAGAITVDEATDLLNDIDVAKYLVELANDLESNVLAQRVISGLMTILKIIN